MIVMLVQGIHASMYTDTYNKAWLLASENYTLSQSTYRQLLNNKKISAERKARICLNMGNDSVRYSEVETAIQKYTQGLKYAPKNEKLKHNLELAKKIKKDPSTKLRDQNKDKQAKEQKQAEQQLNAFKDQEIKDLQQNMQQRRKKYNVEKDW